jgi:hypothetical protein
VRRFFVRAPDGNVVNIVNHKDEDGSQSQAALPGGTSSGNRRVYITGMNRVRHLFAETAPASRPYFRASDPGRRAQAPSTEASELGWASTPEVRAPAPDVQTQGIVGIVTAVVAAGWGGLAAPPAGSVETWIAQRWPF